MIKITATREREFEKALIESQREKYLATDVLERARSDDGYRAKLALLEGFVQGYNTNGLVLDLGANTAGESEFLVSRGYDMVASDINEIALAISQTRARHFGRPTPHYVAADAHTLPFADGTFDCVIAFEVLHHFEKVHEVVRQLHIVLAPGGHLLAYEPYAWNHYRRLAELRFLVLGSIERSFTGRGLVKLLEDHGFRIDSLEKHVLPPSQWKKDHATRLRAILKDLYHAVGRRLPLVFGNLRVVATKDDKDEKVSGLPARPHYGLDVLRCPISGAVLRGEGEMLVAEQNGRRFAYRRHEGIPVLIPSEAVITVLPVQ